VPFERLSRAVRRGTAALKHDVLLFDSIAVMGLERKLATLWETDRAAVADCEYLLEVGVLDDAPENGSEMGIRFLRWT
jgi:hypothetical protein